MSPLARPRRRFTAPTSPTALNTPIEPLEPRTLFSTFDVTSNLDLAVPTPGTLRYAITMANLLPGPDTITFHIPTTPTIHPLTDLPPITGPTTIDATTQPGYAPNDTPVVFIDGSATVQLSGIGLDFTGGNSTLNAIAISGFNTAGVHLGGAGASTVENSYLGPDPSGEPGPETAPQNADGLLIDSPNNSVTSNLISGNLRAGVRLNPGADHTTLTANLIGTDASGAAAFPNLGAGIAATAVSNTLLGAASPASRNLISANGGDGVLFDSPGSGNVIQGNYIGTDITGAAPLGNLGNGVRVTDLAGPGDSSDLLIGGAATAARNIISSNNGDGIGIIDEAGVRVLNNYIGTDATGTSSDSDLLGNFGNGVSLAGAAANTQIGAADPASRNLISDNSGDGVRSTATGAGNIIAGNYIGTDVTGSAPIGNFGNGVSVYAAGLLIGGPTPAAANLISANYGFGVGLFSDASSVQSNLIGTDASASSDLGNHDDNINITGSDNLIGSPTTGNTIAFSGHNGVTVMPSPTYLRNAIRGNNIFSNTALGIDLADDGVTLNDPQDPDPGPNNLQNFPDLSSVTLSGNTATIKGNLNSTPNSTFTLDFFASQIWDTTHYGEGQQYLGSITVTTDAAGNAPFTATMPNVHSGYNYFASTATDATGNTSEFDYDPPANTPPAQSPAANTPARKPPTTLQPTTSPSPTTPNPFDPLPNNPDDDLLALTPPSIL